MAILRPAQGDNQTLRSHLGGWEGPSKCKLMQTRGKRLCQCEQSHIVL